MWLIAAAFVALQLAFVNRYGIFRDELYYIACAEHLGWGYVDHPPFVALVAWVSRRLFGDSLLAIRLLSALCGGAVLLLTGRLALMLGGDRWSAALAAIGVAIAPVMLFLFHILSMNAWDILWWTATAYVVTRIVKEERPRLWLLAGVFIGLGLETKTSMAFLALGLTVGVLLTRERRWLRSRHLWIGAAIAAVVAAPHIAWQVANGWPTIEFIRNASALKNARLTSLQFAGSQLLEMHPVNGVLLLAGLWFFFTAENGRFRIFGWTYVAIFLLVFLQNGKTYYLAPSYPLMFAGGSVGLMRLLSGRARLFRPVVIAVVLAAGAIVLPAAFPLLPVETYIAYTRVLGLRPPNAERSETAELPQFFADMFGWDAIVGTVADVYRSLPPEDQKKVGIVGLNYGVAGAIDFLGPRHGLPLNAISPHNSYYLWGSGDVTGEVLIVVGGRPEDHRESYASVEPVAMIECGYCMPFENHRPVYVLRKPTRSFEEIWRSSKFFF
ncbi:MAG TPA: glycosyltransferase family 39 protein [Vicinamibacterales bacterium]|nr:glycosyltransferase family 39 protein [Vicinamibacterales bacterium]